MIDKFTETLRTLLQGNISERIDLGEIIDKRERDLKRRSPASLFI